MQTGGQYDVSVTMHNNGETTWSRALQYTLMSQAPHNNMTWGLGRVPLPVEEVRPGESATFNFQVTAPPTAGAYLSQWGMQREGHGSFGASTVAAPVGVAAPPPLVNNALAVGMSVPARMITGRRYDVAVAVHNNGTKTWVPGESYSLGSQNPHDNLIGGTGRVALAAPVAPGQQYTFTFPVTAPAPGNYHMQWGMVQDGVEWFGASAGSPVTVTEDLGNVTFIHTDGLGSPIERTDGAGNVISRTRYEPYGQVATGATPAIGFTGHVSDVETGLTYMQQRYYDPVAGRFLSVDPMVTDVNTGNSLNRYVYANNSPYKNVDPDGRQAALAACFGGPVGCVVGVGLTAATAWYGTKAVDETLRLVQRSWAPLKSEIADTSESDGKRNTDSDATREVKIDDKIQGQLGERGWTEAEVRDLANTTTTDTTTDNRRPAKTPDGNGRNDPASVYGSKNGGHIIVNDVTGEVTQISDKKPGWIPDSRIEWR